MSYLRNKHMLLRRLTPHRSDILWRIVQDERILSKNATQFVFVLRSVLNFLLYILFYISKLSSDIRKIKQRRRCQDFNSFYLLIFNSQVDYLLFNLDNPIVYVKVFRFKRKGDKSFFILSREIPRSRTTEQFHSFAHVFLETDYRQV